jgi:hypothetical protein
MIDSRQRTGTPWIDCDKDSVTVNVYEDGKRILDKSSFGSGSAQDTEIAKTLEARWNEFESAGAKSGSRLRLSMRGPLRHPWAYRLLSLGCVTGPGFTGYLGNIWFGLFSYERLHLMMCEIRDLQDEIQRRLAKQRGAE